MLIKEYRIALPLSVEEYRIAQLYMIAKKSREESKGAENGVEFLKNEPYEDGPGGRGQYTHKIYHVGSHLPSWFKGLLPKSALTVEEMAWNSYPYTKTKYTCPFVQRFSLEIETYYCEDAGHQENVFSLSGSELRNRIVDVIDVVKDQLYGADYVKEEDPRVFVSQKTNRGPLAETWINDYWHECKGKKMPLPNGKAIMSAYKLCKVEFHYWGMQSKIERFIHDIALRKTMLRAHRQAWAWQDEWFGLTMEDIREIERQTQEALKRTMACDEDEDNDNNLARESSASSSAGGGDQEPSPVSKNQPMSTGELPSSSRSFQQKTTAPITRGGSGSGGGGTATGGSQSVNYSGSSIKVSVSDENDEVREGSETLVIKKVSPSPRMNPKLGLGEGQRSKQSSKQKLNSPGSTSNKSLELLASLMRMGRDEEDSGGSDDDEFYDCFDGDDDDGGLTKWSSLDLLPQDCMAASVDTDTTTTKKVYPETSFSQSFQHRTPLADRERSRRALSARGSGSRDSCERERDMSVDSTSVSRGGNGCCPTTVLCLVIHAGTVLDAVMDLPTKKSDVTTFRGAFESVIRQHYPSMLGHVVIKLVPSPSISADALGILSSLSPYSFDAYGDSKMTHDTVPIGAIPLLSTSSPEYWDAVAKTVTAANHIYQEFLRSEEGRGFSGQIVLIGDSMGSLLAYDAMTKHSHSAQYNEDEVPPSPAHGLDLEHLQVTPNAGGVDRRRSSSSVSDSGNVRLDFEVSDFFMFGSPLGIVLAHRKVHSDDKSVQLARPCQQVYNLFHPTDPLATRLEPLTCSRFAAVPPLNVARYIKYPLGDGQPYHLLECIQCNQHLFSDSGAPNSWAPSTSTTRRFSDVSIQSGMSGLLDALPLQAINSLTQKWWGNKRMDYALYCPEALADFPTNSLPHLFHASYWESTDAISFLIRQIGFQDPGSTGAHDDSEIRVFTPHQPREKWMKKRTSVKLKNVSANHRANDVIVKEGSLQTLKARFMYGPLDMVTLTGEKVDIYVMRDPPVGEWSQVASEVTDKTGRVSHTLPSDKCFGYGIYPVKMIVRGDHTSADFYIAVVPPKTECVVFSIDGSFTASMSVTGRDPRVRAGAVDVTRHWQELGYLIIYVTGRPDMQHHKVVSWLAQHNFPHGFVSFADGLSTDFLAHKAMALKSLVQDQDLVIHAAYGSSKDISVYSSVGITPDKIFIIGKVAKKQHSLSTVLSEGYSAHLNALMSHVSSRPAHGNARMVIPRSYFCLPGQPMPMRRRRSAKRATSFPGMMSSQSQSVDGSTLSAGGSMSSRGLSPSPRQIIKSHLSNIE